MAEYIDLDKFRKDYGFAKSCKDCRRSNYECIEDHGYSYMDFCEFLDDAEKADVAPVVRCKDCKHSTLPSMRTQIYGKPNTLTCHNRKSPCNRRNVSSSDFCSYGERTSEVSE